MPLDATTVLLAVGGLAALGILAVVFRVFPRVTFVVWLVALLLVPVWVGVSFGIFWSAIVGLTLLAIALQVEGLRFNGLDVVVIALILLLTVLQLAGEVRLSAYLTAVLDWLAFYFWGRIVAERLPGAFITKCLAGAAVVLASLTVIEFLTSTNLFVLIPGSGVSYTTWSPLQERAGFIRAEGALGHSIALGAVLAMLSAFVLAARWRPAAKIAGVALVGAATVFTFSRVGLVTFALTVALSVLFLRELSLRMRLVIGASLTAAALAVVPFLSGVFESAGDEAAGSAGYRTDLLVLLGQVRLMGGDRSWETLVVGDTYLGFFARSVDNAILSILLRFGYLPTALLFAVVIAAIVISARQGMNAAGIAVLAQIVSLFAVALITQYGMLLWFLVGVAATAQSGRTSDPVAREQKRRPARHEANGRDAPSTPVRG